MYVEDGQAGPLLGAGSAAFGSVTEALRAGEAFVDFLNSPVAAELPGAACGDLLTALGEIQAKLAAAHAGFLRRFDAADAHDADGYGSSSAWLAAKAGMSKKAAKAAVRQMRRLGERPLLGAALAPADITDSLAFTIADWTRKLPAEMRDETDRILLEAAAAGASLDDLATIAACAIESWRAAAARPRRPGRRLRRPLRTGRHDVRRRRRHPRRPHPRMRRRGPRGDRGPGQEGRPGRRPYRGPAVPRRAAAGLRAAAARPAGPGPRRRRHPGDRAHPPVAAAPVARRAAIWRTPGSAPGSARTATSPGKDAETAACDAQTVPVVTGTMDLTSSTR